MSWNKLFKKGGIKKRLRLIGWYGQGAHGDDIMAITIKKAINKLAKAKNISIEWINEGKADLVIVGGGTILGADSMNLYEHVKKEKSPIVFFGGGFRRERRDIGAENKRRMKKLFKRASLKGVRGYLSQQLFLHIGIEDTQVIGDPSLLFEPVKVENLLAKFKVAVSVRLMGKTGETQYTDNQTNFKNIAAICGYLIEQYRANLYFFDLAENVHDSDSEGIKAVIDKMRYKEGYTIIPFERNTEEVFSLLGQMNYIVSQRLHPTILGWSQGVPHVALEYQFGKTADFMQSIGMGEFVIRTDEFSMEVYKKKLSRLLREKELIISQAQKSINYWKNKQRDFAKQCLDIID